MKEARVSRRVSIAGRVQGVGFRAWTTERARVHGLGGWVRNETDGTVTALFHGAVPAVEAMVAECHDGPPAAAVSSVTVDAADEAPPPPFGRGY